MTQQAISKHLKVLERAAADLADPQSAQSRPCVLDAEHLDEAAGWIDTAPAGLGRPPRPARPTHLRKHLGDDSDDRDRRAHLPARARRVAELLFDCMTTPEHLTHFWGPAGTTTPVDNITVDLRPGGAFETTMVNDADGSSYTMRAVYVEVRRPDRLVWIEADVEGGMQHHDHLRRPARRAHRGGHPPDQRAGRISRAPRRRPASAPASTGSTPTSPICITQKD